jgi:hypothetical protein
MKVCNTLILTTLLALPSALARAAELTFMSPAESGHRVDICFKWGMECDGEAAEAYCVSRGFTRATSWEHDFDIGGQQPTIVFGTGQICAAPHCDGYLAITCIYEDDWTKTTGNGGLFVKLEWQPGMESLQGALVIAVNSAKPEVAAAVVLDPVGRGFLHAPPGNYLLYIEDFKNLASVREAFDAGVSLEVQKDGSYFNWLMSQ